MVELDLADTLEVGDGDGLVVVDAVSWVGEVRDGAAGDGDARWPGAAGAAAARPHGSEPADSGVGEAASRSNLVHRALEAVGRRAWVRLTKHIPAGAGLGGGSADAAAILRWAGCDDLVLAARLGADVPFCLAGGRALVRGIGEELEALPLLDGVFLLVTPHLAVRTAAVYAAFDELGAPPGDVGNDLEPAALAVAPGLRWWRDLLAAATGERPRLAGSGGTWFVEGRPDQRPELEELGARVRAEVVAGRESALVTVATTVT